MLHQFPDVNGNNGQVDFRVTTSLIDRLNPLWLYKTAKKPKQTSQSGSVRSKTRDEVIKSVKKKTGWDEKNETNDRGCEKHKSLIRL